MPPRDEMMPCRPHEHPKLELALAAIHPLSSPARLIVASSRDFEA